MALNPSQLSRLEKALKDNYRVLLAEVRDELGTPENRQYVKLLDRGPGDDADHAIGEALAGINLAVIDRHVRDLRDIEAAQARIGEGGFGDCVDCGCEIEFARLQAYPTAKRCLVCQQQRERLYAGAGKPAP